MKEDFETFAGPELVRTVEFLCARGNFGYAGLSESYHGAWRYGDLASWIPIGANVCRSTDLFFGLEKQLLDLQDEDGACLTLPRVGLPAGNDDASKVSIEVFWDEAGAIYHVIVHRLVAESEVELELLKQIRARRLAEENFQATREKLARQELLLTILMEKLPVAAAIFDHRRRYLFATRQWARDFRIECEPLIGQDLFDAGPDIPERQAQGLVDCLSGLAVGPSIESTATDQDGHISHRWTQQAWRARDGSADGAIIAAENLTDLITERRQLKSENASYKGANRKLSDALSIVSHDLNAPLRSLRQLIETIDIAAHPAQASGTTSRIRQHIDRLERILEGAADYGRHSSSEPATGEVNIAALLREIVKTLPGHHCFSFKIALERETIPINGSIFDLIFRNLLDNAMKHHDRGEGHITVSSTDCGDHWQFQLTDDGPGIPFEQQRALLGEAAESRPPNGGRGRMGLTIVKRALNEIGGTIGIQSEPARSRGSTFILCWPAAPAKT